MKKVIIKILSIFMMILMVVSGMGTIGYAMTFEEKCEFNEKLPVYLKQELGENIPAANEINDYFEGALDYIIDESDAYSDYKNYCYNLAYKIFEQEDNKEYLKENGYTDTAKFNILKDWFWDCVHYTELDGCDKTCINYVDCHDKGHQPWSDCQTYSKVLGLILGSIDICTVFEYSENHIETYPIELLLNKERWMPSSTERICFVSGNILYIILVQEDGSFNIEKKYVTTHECKFNIHLENKDINSTCVKRGSKTYKCSVHDEKTGVYCTSTNTVEFPIKPHTFNNRIFNKKFHAGEYSTEKNINNVADTTGELINGKMTYTNCDGTTVSTENYGGYYNDQPKLNIWGYNNTDQEGALVTNNFHACEVAEVSRYVCDRTLDTDDMLCDDKFLYEITEPEEVTYTDKVIEATCDMGGYTLRTCNNCGESRKVNKSNTNALGCDFDGAEVIVEKAPTCDTSILGQGYGYQVCKHEGCNKTNSVTITERAKHNLSIVVSGYNDIESVVNDSCVDQYVYGYVYCSVCDRRIKPTDINESDYPDVYQKYSDICDFDEYGNVKITVKATGNHKFITAYEYDKNGNPIPCNLCVVCQYKEYLLNDDDSDNKTPDKDENDDEDKTPEIDEDEDINNPDVCTHKSTRYKTTKATYTKSGKRVYYCKKCGAVVKTTTIPKLTLKVPKFKLYKGKRYFKVRYTNVKDATGFQVQYKIKGKWKLKTFKTKTTSIKFVKNLKKGKYIVRIRALRAVKGGYVYSNWSKIKSVSVK